MINNSLTIASEIRELENLLAAIPEGNVIERMSLESRLESARAALAALPQQMIAPKARLTFRGKPVFGSHGIAADFGGKAAGAFSDAFAAVAAGLSESLRDMGPIPNRDKNQLVITSTAIGSFGFEFELPARIRRRCFPKRRRRRKPWPRLRRCSGWQPKERMTKSQRSSRKFTHAR